MKNKRILYLLGAAVLLIIIVVWLIPSGSTDVPTYTVTKDDFNVFVVESGTVRAKNSSTVSAPRRVSGNLQIVYLASEGSIVKKDDVLVKFDPSAAMRQVEEKRTELKSALADLDKLKAQQAGDEAQAKTDFETAKLNFQLAEIAKERMQFEPEAKKREAQLEFERAKLSFEQAKNNVQNKNIVRKSELGNLQRKLAQIRSDLKEVQDEMGELTITAPINGLVVYENNWATGRKIAVGDQPWRSMPLISLPDLSEAQVEISVNEMEIAKVKKDQRVLVTPDAFPDKHFKGTITSVSQIGRQTSSKENVFDIVVDLDSTDEVLKPGITTTNKIVVETIDDVISVPIISVFEEDQNTYVYVQSGGSFDKTEVTLGVKNDNFVIVKKGVEPGDKVALRNPEKENGEDDEKVPEAESSPSGPAVAGKP